MTRGLLMAVTATLGPALISSGLWAAGLCKVTVPLDSRNARLAESNLGDLVADGARAALNADLALLPASQLREEVIPAGELAEQALEAALLYPDENVVLVETTGEKLKAALELGLSALSQPNPQPSPAFLQVSGLTVEFRSAKPAGARVESVKVGNEPLAPGKTYRVAVPSSLAKGGMGYFRVFDGLKPKQTGPSLSQAVVNYARASRVVAITAGQRLRDLSTPAPKG
jgi:2',3'-cyclic-nucleotide 2'-phosphodiesterase (5'-nucleotidase family)